MDSWGDMARTIAEQSHAAWIYFVMFVSFAGLGLMNLLTAVFVEALIEQVQGIQYCCVPLHPVLQLCAAIVLQLFLSAAALIEQVHGIQYCFAVVCRAATCAAVVLLLVLQSRRLVL